MAECGNISNLQSCNTEGVCSSFSLSTDPASCYINSLVEEHLNIGASPINVFKLLGIHEQGKLIDLTGNGSAISSGEYPDYRTTNAFNDNTSEWRSVQKGTMISTAGWIGYDFGPILLDDDRLRYSVDTQVKHHITTIKIQQGCDSKNRVSKARIERSIDGITWFGVSIVNLPDTNNIETISFKQSAPSRYWRIRPITFLGGISDYWAVKQLEMIDYSVTRLDNIQDEYGFLENRDRAYAKESIAMKGYYDLQEFLTDLSRFGIDMSGTQQFVFKISFNSAVKLLGRPIIIGDIIEVPSEAQYTPDLKEIKKFLEVTDVGWASEGFTPGWKPTIQRVAAMPMMASQETLDIIGDINTPSSVNEFFNLEQPLFGMESFTANAKIDAEANSQVPERGEDIADIRVFTESEIQEASNHGINIGKLNVNQRAIYVEDGLPPNGLPYTEGMSWPINPTDGDYHRLTYEARLNVPARLHKFSIMKNRWVFVEEDKRRAQNSGKPMLSSLLQDPNRIHNNEIT